LRLLVLLQGCPPPQLLSAFPYSTTGVTSFCPLVIPESNLVERIDGSLGWDWHTWPLHKSQSTAKDGVGLEHWPLLFLFLW
ncbi:mCG145108, partial [Mus musculus]